MVVVVVLCNVANQERLGIEIVAAPPQIIGDDDDGDNYVSSSWRIW